MNLVLPPEAAQKLSHISSNTSNNAKTSINLDARQSFLLPEGSSQQSGITVLKSKHIILKHQSSDHHDSSGDDEHCFVKGYN